MAGLLGAAALAGPVEDGLRDAIRPCHQWFTMQEATPDTLVMEPRNGFAEVGGAYPTCGCTCTATAAAFRTAAGDHRVLGTLTEGCNQTAALTGADWARVLPGDLREALLPGVPEAETRGVFALFATLPRKGTTTTVTLRPIPLGRTQECAGGLCLGTGSGFREGAPPVDRSIAFRWVQGMVKAGLGDAELAAFRDGGLAALSPEVRAAAEGAHRHGDRAAMEAEARAILADAWSRWPVVQARAFETAVLRWDRAGAGFTLDREASTAMTARTMARWLLEVEHFTAMC